MPRQADPRPRTRGKLKQVCLQDVPDKVRFAGARTAMRYEDAVVREEIFLSAMFPSAVKHWVYADDLSEVMSGAT